MSTIKIAFVTAELRDPEEERCGLTEYIERIDDALDEVFQDAKPRIYWCDHSDGRTDEICDGEEFFDPDIQDTNHFMVAIVCSQGMHKGAPLTELWKQAKDAFLASPGDTYYLELSS